MKKTIFVFALIIIALVLLFQLGTYNIFSGNFQMEFVISGIAILFFFFGVFMNKKSLARQKNPLTGIDHHKIKDLEISNREYEVLKAMASGLSNKEIADTLFVSESTIKTHVSNLLVKLGAKRRTQAVQIAQKHNIL